MGPVLSLRSDSSVSSPERSCWAYCAGASFVASRDLTVESSCRFRFPISLELWRLEVSTFCCASFFNSSRFSSFLSLFSCAKLESILQIKPIAHTMYLSRRFCFLEETCSCCDLSSSLSFSRLASLSLLEAGWISATLVSTGAAFAASLCLCFCFRWRGTNLGIMAKSLSLSGQRSSIHKTTSSAKDSCP